jgi:hypothetical protein
MSETEAILKNQSGVKAFEGEHAPSGLKPGTFLGLGTLMLTDRRLVYVNKGKGAYTAIQILGGPLTWSALEKKVSKAELGEAMKLPGSFSIPLEDITSVQNERHMTTAYLIVGSQSPYLKPVHSFIFGQGVYKNEDWVNAINSAVAAARSLQISAQPTTSQTPPPPPPPPPSAPAVPLCPSCGSPLTYIQQYQRWYCYREKRYI